jgi:dihydroorotate dehydrogenase
VYKYILKPFFFLFDPEEVHYLVFDLLRIVFFIPFVKPIIKWFYTVDHMTLRREVMGLTFANPVGMAAGFDKDARLYGALENFGFGFVEIGTVTPIGQPGNPKPRLFRLSKNEALINRMGFNNEGSIAAAERLTFRKPGMIIGGNIGKNKETANENAKDDYLKCLKVLYPFVDYFVVNVSSPNTPNLRALQDKGPLKEILEAVVEEMNKQPKYKPVCLKIAPDLSLTQLDEIIEIVLECRIDGVIATNTTISREGLDATEIELAEIGNGGLSGKPLKAKSTEIIRYLREKGQGKFAIIGVGGIQTSEDALEKLMAGADLVQIYTGFIYEGPGMVKSINQGLAKTGFPKHISALA